MKDRQKTVRTAGAMRHIGFMMLDLPGNQGMIEVPLCLKLAIAANQPDGLGVMSDIADYFADIELARLKADCDYTFAIRKEWMRRGLSCAPSVGEYVMNPFLSLWDQCSNEHFCRRYAKLASITERSFRAAK